MDDLALALLLADHADALTLPAFAARPTATRKDDGSPVTAADGDTERALRALLAEHRPHDAVLGEEQGTESPWSPGMRDSMATQTQGSGRRRWILDPIDGTEAFARGIPVFGTLIALEQDGRTELGVVSAPALGRRWWARRGHGAHADGRRIAVSDTARLAEAAVAPANLYLGRDEDRLAGMIRLVRAAARAVAADSFLGPVLVAEGALDASASPSGELWDHAASQVIVEEAGGRFTDFAGRDTAAGGCCVASNGVLHREVLAALAGR